MSHTKNQSALLSLTLPIYVPSILMTFGVGIIILVVPLLAVEITGSYSLASLMFAMVGLGTLLADVPAGLLISRMGVKPAMFLGVLFMSCSAWIGGTTDSALVLSASGFLLGVGRGLVMLSRMTYIADCTTDDTGRAMATVGGMMRIGAFTGPIFGGFVAEFIGHGFALIIAGFIMATAFAFIGFLSANKSSKSTHHHKNPVKTVARIVTNYRSVFLTAGFAVIGLQLLRASRVLIVPLWGKSIGLDAAEIGLLTGLPMGLEMTMFYPVGLIMDRFGRKWTSVPCIGILALAIGMIPFCDSFFTMLTVVLFGAIGNGLGSGIFLTLGADFSPAEGRSDFLGVWRLIGDTGHTAGPFLISFLTEALTLAVAAFATAAIGILAAATMLFFVQETRNIES